MPEDKQDGAVGVENPAGARVSPAGCAQQRLQGGRSSLMPRSAHCYQDDTKGHLVRQQATLLAGCAHSFWSPNCG